MKGIKEIIPDEKYKIRLPIGDRKQVTFKGTFLDAIKQKKKMLNSFFEKNEGDVKERYTFAEASELYIKDCYKRNERGVLDVNTIAGYITVLEKEIVPYFENDFIDEIKPNNIENFLDYLRNRPRKDTKVGHLSETSIDKMYSVLSAVFTFSKKKRWIKYNPANDIDNKPVPKKYKKELTYFKPEEVIYALMCIDKYANIRLKTFLNIIFALGCRREEVAGLRWKDIDFSSGEVNYVYAVTSYVSTRFVNDRIRVKDLKTYNSYRTNILSDKCLLYLKKYYNFKIASGLDVTEDDHIFTRWDSNELADPNKLSCEWRRFKSDYNIKNVDLHRIRHTVANLLERSGVPKKDIANMLGNTQRVLEEFYTHVDFDELKNMRNILDSKLYSEIDFVAMDIELISKIINQYPMDAFSEDELKQIDMVLEATISFDNYDKLISHIKEDILIKNKELYFFVDEDKDSLQIKINTYKMFNDKKIKVKKIKSISIMMDVFSF